MKQLTFGSLFAGIGGLDLGFERSGMVCKWQVEIDDYARRVLEKHWPNVRRWDDVRTFPQEPIDEWKVDVICGGFPCQDISYAGRGAGLEGERSGLFFDAIRVVRQLKPRIVVLENVAALLTRGLDRVLGELAEIGFDAEWHCIPAAAVGAPHIRDRVFVLANASGERLSVPTCVEQPSVRETQGTSKGSQFGGGNAETGAHWKTEPSVGRVANGVSNRVDRLRGLGNAVVPQVAEFIGRRIVEAVSGEQTKGDRGVTIREPETQETFDDQFQIGERDAAGVALEIEETMGPLRRAAGDFVRSLFLKHGYFNGRAESFVDHEDDCITCRVVVSCYGLPNTSESDQIADAIIKENQNG